MSLFQSLPMDIVKLILLFDKRFILRKGQIIVINKLEKVKYSNVFEFFLKTSNIIRPILGWVLYLHNDYYYYETQVCLYIKNQKQLNEM